MEETSKVVPERSSSQVVKPKVIRPKRSSSQVDQPSLARDRARRVSVGPSKRQDFEDIVTYGLHVVEDVDSYETSTYKEVVLCSEYAHWLSATRDGMKSLGKNQIWE